MKNINSSFLLLAVMLTSCSSINYKPTLPKNPIYINDQTDTIHSKLAPRVSQFAEFKNKKVNHFTLKNGLTVLHFQTQYQITPSTQIGLFLHNPEPYNPIALKLHANWNLLRIAKKNYKLSALAANLGAEIQTLSDSIATGWYFETLLKDQSSAIELLSKLVNSRDYNPKELAHQKQMYALEQQLKSVSGLSLSQKLYNNLVFTEQSSVSKSSTTSLRKKLLKKITAEDLKQYFINNFKPKNMVLVILSPTLNEELKAEIETSFNSFQQPTPTKPIKVNQPQSLKSKSRIQLRELISSTDLYAISRPHSTQVDIRVSFTPLMLSNIEYQSFKLFADVLAGSSLNSSMQSDLRERQGLSYSISSQLTQNSDFHSLHFLASTENFKLPALLDGIQQHIKHLLDNGLTEKEFNFIKRRRLVNLERSRLHPYRKMSFMLQNFTNDNPLDKISHEAQELSKLSYNEFISFLKRLQKQPRINILTGDKLAIKQHMCKLKKCTIQWFNKKLNHQD